ncbi:MAG: hypothetical protein JSW41_05575, partial [Candidatus Aenigmatarchaeota archaeon]
MKRVLICLCALLLMTLIPFFSEEVEGALLEDAMWETLDCPFTENGDDGPTTLVDGGGGILYIGSYDSTSPYEASIYQWDGSSCTFFQDTDQYYIYSSVVYNGSVFWGSRESPSNLNGRIYTYQANGTFNFIDHRIWFNVGANDPWTEAMIVYDDRLFITGTYSVIGAPWNNHFYMKWCSTTGCWDAALWDWVDTNQANIGRIDDAISMAEYISNLYVGTYDPAIVLRYYNNNQTVWHSLNEQYAQALYSTYPDGVPDTTTGQGIYGMTVLGDGDGCLHVFTYAWGHNWTLCDTGLNWAFNNLTQNQNLIRSMNYSDVIYHGARDNNGDYILQTFDNYTFMPVFESRQSTYHWQYIEEFQSELYATDQVYLYHRMMTAPLVEIKSPNQGESVQGYINFVARVDDSTKTVDDCTFLLGSTYYHCSEDSRGFWVHENYNTRHTSNGRKTLYLQVNWSDNTISRDSVDFFVNNRQPTYLDCIEDSNGNLICPTYPPHKPKWGRTRSDMIVVDPYLTVIFEVIDTPSPSTSVSLNLPYETGEASVTVMSDQIHLNGVNSTDRVWLNDTVPTAIYDVTGFYYYNLLGARNSNYTVESECVLTVTRTSMIRIVREFNWSKDPQTDIWNYRESFANEIDSGNTIRNVWFYWSKALDTNIDSSTVEVWDLTNDVELDISRHYSVDYGGFQLEIDAITYASSRAFSLEYQEEDLTKIWKQIVP